MNTKIISKHTKIFLIITLYFIICGRFNITCPIKLITGLPCPTCGTTHAIKALMSLDITSYIKYNPMAVFMLLAVWLCIHRKIFRNKLLITSIAIAILILNLIIYIFHLYQLIYK